MAEYGPRRPRQHSRRRWLITGAAIAGGCLLLASTLLLPPVRGWIRHRQAATLQQRGEAAWARGAVREAVLSFASARELEPSNPRPLLRQGQLLLRTGARAEGRALFRAALAPGSPYSRDLVAATYHDALLGTGWWTELATLALEEIPRHDALYLLWLQSGLEAVRLAQWSPAELAAACGRGSGRFTTLERALLAAGADGPEGPARLRAALAATHGSLTVEASWLAARLWYRSGNPAAARLARARAGRLLNGSDQAIDQVLSYREDRALAGRSLQRTVAASANSPGGRENLFLTLCQLLAQPDHDFAVVLSASARPQARALPGDTKVAIWLYCGLSQAGEEERFWRGEVDQVAHSRLLDIAERPFDDALFGYLVNALNLRRELLLGLTAALPKGTANPRRPAPSHI